MMRQVHFMDVSEVRQVLQPIVLKGKDAVSLHCFVSVLPLFQCFCSLLQNTLGAYSEFSTLIVVGGRLTPRAS